MASESTRILWLSLVVLASVAAGVLIGSALSRTSPPVSPVSSGPVNDEFTTALGALTTELARVRGELGASVQASAPTQRVDAAVTGAGDIAKEIREATKQLSGAIEQLRLVSMRVSGDRAPLVPPRNPPDPSVIDVITEDAVWDQAREYQMWTYQQVLDRFGEPQRIGRGDGKLTWTYTLASGKEVWFHFTDGRVFEVGCSAPPR